MSQHVSRASVTTAGTLALLLLLIAGLLGCSTGTAPESNTDLVQALRSIEPQIVAPAAQGKAPLRLRAQPQLPQAARTLLSGVSAPALPGNRAASKTASVALPSAFPADQAYPGGPGNEQGYIDSHNVIFPGGPPPLGGADMLPTGTTYPDNISWIIYRMDDVTQAPGLLTINFGLTAPGTMVGVAPYNWAYGSNGQWAPLAYADPAANGGVIQVQLFGFPGEDFTNGSDDLAFMLFVLAPGGTNVQSIQLEEGGGVNPNYDEVEPNQDDITSTPLPAFPFGGFDGNVGIGGSYDGSLYDTLSFSAAPGDLIDLTLFYDPAADYDPIDFSGVAVYFVDQEFFTTQDPQYTSGYGGSGGVITVVDHQIDPAWGGPFYLIVLNDNQVDVTVPPTDYSLAGVGPGGSGYDEIEPNQNDLEATPLPMFPFTGFTGNAGADGVYDGTLYDSFSLNVAPGTSFNFTLNYDPAAEDDGSGFGVHLFILDQQFWAMGDPQYYADYSSAGAGGTLTVNHSLDPTWAGPFYVVVQNDNFNGPAFPATDYSLDGSL